MQPHINQAGIKLENSVIGLIINEPNAAKLARYLLSPDDFQQLACKKIFSIAMNLLDENQAVDQTDLMTRISDPDEVKAISASLLEYSILLTPNLSGESKIRDLQKYSDLMHGVVSLQAVISDIQTKKLMDPIDLSNRLKNISESLLTRHKREISLPLPVLLRLAMDRQSKTEDKVYFNLAPIDKATNGLERRELVTIAARTGVGKSALCMHPLIKTGVFDDKAVLFFSTEMDATRMTRRMLANISGVSQAKLKHEEPMTEYDHNLLAQFMPMVHESKVQFIDQVKYLDQIENAIQIEQDSGTDVRMIIIDYLQMLHIRDYKKTRQQELSEISESLLRIGRKHDLTVLAVAQLSREAVKGKNGALNRYAEPDISQIKDCGSIEQDSDRIILLWQDQSDEHLTHCHLAKNREGLRSYFDLKFYGSVMRFYPQVN